ncbi:MAG: PilZ domain-containing protein [Myxococcota bacterium]|nr:PilZ domain-containing protein [Myxococcota bacterium]
MSDEASRKRRDRRVHVQMPVRVSSIDPELDPQTGRPCYRSSQETCSNLSLGGASLRTTDPLSPGRRLLVEIHVPEGETIETVAKVAWSKTVIDPHAGATENAIGVQFVGGNRDAIRKLEHVLDGSGEGPLEQ